MFKLDPEQRTGSGQAKGHRERTSQVGERAHGSQKEPQEGQCRRTQTEKGMREAEEAGRGQILQDLIDHVKNLLFCFKLLKGQGVQWVIFMDTKTT